MTLRTSAAGGLSRFAHLTGLGRKKADDTPATVDDVDDVQDAVDDVEDDVEDVKDDLEETKDKVEQLEEQIDDKKDEDEPSDDKPAEQAAFRRGRVAGRKAERARCAAIFATPEAGQNPTLAASLAFDSRVTANEARNLLRAGVDGSRQASSGPTDTQSGKLEARMQGSKRLDVGSGADAGGSDKSTPKGLADHAVKLAQSAGVVK